MRVSVLLESMGLNRECELARHDRANTTVAESNVA
jgi:hypothetical protein